jgi:hypothetical protein
MYKFIFGFLAGLAAASGYFLWGDPKRELSEGPEMSVESHDRRSLPHEPPQPVNARATPAVLGAERKTGGRGTAGATGGDGTSRSATPVPSPEKLDIPGGVLGADAAKATPLAELLGAFRVDCQFGPGGGGSWPRGNLFPHTAAWQGGLVTFDAVDIATGKARLKNFSGMTGTPDGELDVRVFATDSGLHFTVFKPDGELMAASVYASLDVQRKHIAVVSLHGPNLAHESAQFYGACTL